MNTYDIPTPTAAVEQPNKSGKAMAAFVLGIVAIALGWLIPFVGWGCGIPAIVMGLGAAQPTNTPYANRAKIGWILGIVGTAISTLFFFAWMGTYSSGY